MKKKNYLKLSFSSRFSNIKTLEGCFINKTELFFKSKIYFIFFNFLKLKILHKTNLDNTYTVRVINGAFIEKKIMKVRTHSRRKRNIQVRVERELSETRRNNGDVIRR